MKVYILTLKDTPDYSYEVRIFLAKDKRSLNKTLKEQNLNIKHFDVEIKTKEGEVYVDIY